MEDKVIYIISISIADLLYWAIWNYWYLSISNLLKRKAITRGSIK